MPSFIRYYLAGTFLQEDWGSRLHPEVWPLLAPDKVSGQCKCAIHNGVVTCEITLFQNYFSLRRHPSEIILFQSMEICLKLFYNYFGGLLQLMNIFQHAQCR